MTGGWTAKPSDATRQISLPDRRKAIGAGRDVRRSAYAERSFPLACAGAADRPGRHSTCVTRHSRTIADEPLDSPCPRNVERVIRCRRRRCEPANTRPPTSICIPPTSCSACRESACPSTVGSVARPTFLTGALPCHAPPFWPLLLAPSLFFAQQPTKTSPPASSTHIAGHRNVALARTLSIVPGLGHA